MNDFVDLRQYVTMVIRWWWLLILGTVVAAVMGYAISQRQPRVYEASTTLMVGQSFQAINLDTRDIQTSEQLAQTYADIARRQPVLQAALDELHLSTSWKSLKANTRVKIIAGTQLLEIRVEADSPEKAQHLADEIARQLIRLSPTADLQDQENSLAKRFVQAQLEILQTKIETGQAQILDLEAGLASPQSADEAQSMRSNINTLERLVADWQANYMDLLTFENGKRSSNYLTVIESAQVDPSATRPRVLLNTLLAGMVGLALALGGVFGREFFDDTLQSDSDLDRALGLGSLGSVGRFETSAQSSQLIAVKKPFSLPSEAYRIIRGNIQLTASGRSAKTLMVTSPEPGDGKSVAVANLGVVMAQAGLKTIVVDGDLRRPTIHHIFDLPNLGGLSGMLLAPEFDVASYLRDTPVDNLKVITSGILPRNPSELLSSPRMKTLIGALKDMADVVIFDSPPVLAVADATALSAQMEGVILLFKAGRTRRGAAQQAALHLQRVGANVLGGILNGAQNSLKDYYSQTGPQSIARSSWARVLDRVRKAAGPSAHS